MAKTINLETIILEAYGCKNAHDFQQSFDVSMQMVKEIATEAIRQALELAAENANINVNRAAYGHKLTEFYKPFSIDEQSILDTIKQVK